MNTQLEGARFHYKSMNWRPRFTVRTTDARVEVSVEDTGNLCVIFSDPPYLPQVALER